MYGVVPLDEFKLEIKISRYEMGAPVSFNPTNELVKLPFTLGPWAGTAHLTRTQELSFADGLITLAFDMELLTSEKLTIAEVLQKLFGATIHPTQQGEPDV